MVTFTSFQAQILLDANRELLNKNSQEIIDRQKMLKEKILKLAEQSTPPKIVNILREDNPGNIVIDTLAFKQVIQVMAELCDKTYPTFILAILEITLGNGGGQGMRFLSAFEELYFNSKKRKEFWNTSKQLPILLGNALLKDLCSGINIDDPTEDELEKSAVMSLVFKENLFPED